MDLKRAKQLAGVTEQSTFRDPSEMLQTLLFTVRKLRDSYQRELDSSVDSTAMTDSSEVLESIVEDLNHVLARFENAQVKPRR